jgi:hypothetical protein
MTTGALAPSWRLRLFNMLCLAVRRAPYRLRLFTIPTHRQIDHGIASRSDMGLIIAIAQSTNETVSEVARLTHPGHGAETALRSLSRHPGLAGILRAIHRGRTAKRTTDRVGRSVTTGPVLGAKSGLIEVLIPLKGLIEPEWRLGKALRTSKVLHARVRLTVHLGLNQPQAQIALTDRSARHRNESPVADTTTKGKIDLARHGSHLRDEMRSLQAALREQRVVLPEHIPKTDRRIIHPAGIAEMSIRHPVLGRTAGVMLQTADDESCLPRLTHVVATTTSLRCDSSRILIMGDSTPFRMLLRGLAPVNPLTEAQQPRMAAAAATSKAAVKCRLLQSMTVRHLLPAQGKTGETVGGPWTTKECQVLIPHRLR